MVVEILNEILTYRELGNLKIVENYIQLWLRHQSEYQYFMGRYWAYQWEDGVSTIGKQEYPVSILWAGIGPTSGKQEYPVPYNTVVS